jgi:hypothetical protein
MRRWSAALTAAACCSSSDTVCAPTGPAAPRRTSRAVEVLVLRGDGQDSSTTSRRPASRQLRDRPAGRRSARSRRGRLHRPRGPRPSTAEHRHPAGHVPHAVATRPPPRHLRSRNRLGRSRRSGSCERAASNDASSKGSDFGRADAEVGAGTRVRASATNGSEDRPRRRSPRRRREDDGQCLIHSRRRSRAGSGRRWPRANSARAIAVAPHETLVRSRT